MTRRTARSVGRTPRGTPQLSDTSSTEALHHERRLAAYSGYRASSSYICVHFPQVLQNCCRIFMLFSFSMCPTRMVGAQQCFPRHYCVRHASHGHPCPPRPHKHVQVPLPGATTPRRRSWGQVRRSGPTPPARAPLRAPGHPRRDGVRGLWGRHRHRCRTGGVWPGGTGPGAKLPTESRRVSAVE